MIELIFWLSLILVIYVYFGYPMSAASLSYFFNYSVSKSPLTPSVTVLIPAYNEEAYIRSTVCNKLSQDYQKDKLEIIVISDDSTDNTDDIVRSIEDNRVRLIRQHPRSGKTSAINTAISHARGDFIIFSDANSIYAQDAIKHLISNFSDPTVGYVTGKMIYTNADGTIIGDGCTAYMKYENALRKIETRLGSIIGVDGGVDAIRKELYKPMSPDQLPDFVLPLNVVDQGYRVVYEPRAILRETSLKRPSDEYRMRVRVSLRAFWALFDMRHLLWFNTSFLFSWQLWSHKLLRYCCFIFLVTAFISNLSLVSDAFYYKLLLLVQVSFYSLPLLTLNFQHPLLQHPLVKLISYFSLLNIASAHAFLKFVLGHKTIVWTPRKG